MAMPEERMLAFGQHNAHQKLKCRLGAGGCGMPAGNCGGANGLARYKVEGKSTACQHFSIRGVLNTKKCWPFPQHLLEVRLKDGYDPVLPPLDIPEYRWWACQKCISGVNTTAEISVEKEDINNLLEPSQEYDGQLISHKEDELTKEITDQTRIESLVPTGLETKNVENLNSRVKKCEALLHSSNFPVWNSNLLHFSKDSLDSCKSDAIRDNNQVPQDASEMWRNSNDKSLWEGSFHLENGQSKQKDMGLDDEIPMDIVEFMAKNQHERGLPKPLNIYESHNIQTDKSLMKMKAKETDFSHVAELLDRERISQKHNSGIPNRVAQLGQSNQANSRAYLGSPTGIDALCDTSKIHVSQTSPKRLSVNSGTEGIKSVSSQSHSSMMQSPQLFNPLKSYCSGSATSVFSGINAASNPPIPVVHSTKPHVVITHCDHNGHFSINDRALPAVQCEEATADGRHKQMQNLCKVARSALSELAAVHHHWIYSLMNSQERPMKAENLSNLMSSRNSDLEITRLVSDPGQSSVGEVVKTKRYP